MLRFLLVFLVGLGSAYAGDVENNLTVDAAPTEAVLCVKRMDEATVKITKCQGCCSRHGGVCGCNKVTGNVWCCDGSFSPGCGCLKDGDKVVE